MQAEALRIVLRGAYLRRALWVTLIVGTILNAINQGDAVWGPSPIHWPKFALTYCVPFCVATYGAWSAVREARRASGLE